MSYLEERGRIHGDAGPCRANNPVNWRQGLSIPLLHAKQLQRRIDSPVTPTILVKRVQRDSEIRLDVRWVVWNRILF